MRSASASAVRSRAAVLVVYEDYARDSRVRRHARSLVRAGWQVQVIALGGELAHEAARADGVKLLTTTARKYRGGGKLRYAVAYAWFTVRTGAALFRQSMRRPPSVVIVSGPPDAIVFAAVPVRLRGVRVALDVHDMTSELFAAKFFDGRPSTMGRLVRLVETASYRAVDGILTVHPGYRERIAARVRCPVVDVLNTPDDAAWLAAGDERPVTDVVGRPLVLAHHGTIVYRFGIDLAVRAVAVLRDRGVSVELRILGDGDFAADAEALVAELELADRVDFDRRVFRPEEVPAFLEGVDAGIAPYRMSSFLDEAVPVKILEYLTLGLPVIATPTHALRRVVPDDVIHYVPDPTPEHLADAVEALLDPAVRRNLRERSRPVAAAIAWPAQEARLLGWLDGLVEG